jgi:hypothetical protein
MLAAAPTPVISGGSKTAIVTAGVDINILCRLFQHRLTCLAIAGPVET